MTAIHHTASTPLRPIGTDRVEGRTAHRALDLMGTGLAVLIALAVTALPAAWVLMLGVAALGGSISYVAALPIGLLAAVLPFAIGAGLAAPLEELEQPRRGRGR